MLGDHGGPPFRRRHGSAPGFPLGFAVADPIFGGGVLRRTPDGAVAGSVGVSAGAVEQDHQVAEAGRKAFAGD
ncbi:MAG: hypothetical protein K0R87_2555 [Pseudonocardia sp.]|nr:hypothetical protein [Pseudonocardia sp.]